MSEYGSGDDMTTFARVGRRIHALPLGVSTARSRVLGLPSVALCGSVFHPSNDPSDDFPFCLECALVLREDFLQEASECLEAFSALTKDLYEGGHLEDDRLPL